MSISKLARIAGTGVLVAVPLVTAVAQTQSPPAPAQSPPAAIAPQTTPPDTPQATSPTTPAEKKAAAPIVTANLVGLSAKSSDGHNLGAVQSIREPGGKTVIGVKVGGFLGCRRGTKSPAAFSPSAAAPATSRSEDRRVGLGRAGFFAAGRSLIRTSRVKPWT